MFDQQHDLPPSEQRVVQALVDEHLQASCQLVPIDDQTWAIRGSIAYEGEVILERRCVDSERLRRRRQDRRSVGEW